MRYGVIKWHRASDRTGYLVEETSPHRVVLFHSSVVGWFFDRRVLDKDQKVCFIAKWVDGYQIATHIWLRS